jgi:hypothetical protein
LEAAPIAENFIEIDEKLGKDGKRKFNFMLGRHSITGNRTNRHGFSL